jgi:chemotaxis protein CheZ
MPNDRDIFLTISRLYSIVFCCFDEDSMTTPAPKSENIPADLSHVVNSVQAQLDAMQRFVSRRFDEISMEINATSQQVDMAEEGIKNRFAEILEILGAISWSGDGSSPANTGVELEAVINDSEKAANTILDAADRIANRIDPKLGEDWNDEAVRRKALEGMANDVQDILMACTFQDLTGQRIRKTLENLRSIEDRLSTTLERLGIKITPSATNPAVARATSQSDIDEMFG